MYCGIVSGYLQCKQRGILSLRSQLADEHNDWSSLAVLQVLCSVSTLLVGRQHGHLACKHNYRQRFSFAEPESTRKDCTCVLHCFTCDPAISSFLPLTCTAAVPTEWHNYSVSSLLYSCHYKQILNVILTASAANTCNQYNLNLEAQTDQSESDYWLRPSSGLSPSSTASMWVIWSSSSTMSRSLITAGWSCYSHNICQNSHTLIVKVH